MTYKKNKLLYGIFCMLLSYHQSCQSFWLYALYRGFIYFMPSSNRSSFSNNSEHSNSCSRKSTKKRGWFGYNFGYVTNKEAKATKDELIQQIGNNAKDTKKIIDDEFNRIKNKVTFLHTMQLGPLNHNVSMLNNKLKECKEDFSHRIESKNKECLNKIEIIEKTFNVLTNNVSRTCYVTQEQLNNITKKIELCNIAMQKKGSKENIKNWYENQKKITKKLSEKSNQLFSEVLFLKMKVLNSDPVIEGNSYITNFLHKDGSSTDNFLTIETIN